MNLSNVKIGTRLYMGFGAVVLILVVLVSVAYNNFDKLGRANDINVHTYQVTAEVKAALESLLNVETGQRGYTLTGDPASLEPYNAGRTAVQSHISAAIKLTADNPRQQERLTRLATEYAAWLKDAVDPVITLRRETADGDQAPVVALFKEGKGKRAWMPCGCRSPRLWGRRISCWRSAPRMHRHSRPKPA